MAGIIICSLGKYLLCCIYLLITYIYCLNVQKGSYTTCNKDIREKTHIQIISNTDMN